MGVYSSAYLIYGIEIHNNVLDGIINNEEYQYFDKIHLRYLRPSEYVCTQYTPLLGLEIGEAKETTKKIVIPSDLQRHFKEAIIQLYNKIGEMYNNYNTHEYDCSKGELAKLRDKIGGIKDKLDPSFFLAINKL